MSQSVLFDYRLADAAGRSGTAQAWARVPPALSAAEQASIVDRIKFLLKARQAVLVAHYYVDGAIQDLALESGGCVADSLEMARFGHDHPARTLVVAGVRFMGETSKILSPHKQVLMPDLDATCSLDLGCPPEAFAAFCDAHPEREVVVYANTSAAVKARAHWMVTSACAIEIVRHLHEQGRSILWAPDQHLGRYIQRETGADMLMWQGACIVHDEFKGLELELLRREHPDALVLVHPESPESVVAQADVVGSTSRLLKAVMEGSAHTYIVATDNGILHRMRQLAPDKRLIEAPTAGLSATCKSCAHCPWMAMNGMKGILACLEQGTGEISVPDSVQAQARSCIKRMLDFTASSARANASGPGGRSSATGLVPNIGAA